MEVVAPERRRGRRLAHPGDEECDAARRERGLEPGDRLRPERGLREDHRVHASGLAGGRLDERRDEAGVERCLRRELEEAEEVAVHVLEQGRRRGAEVARRDRQRPRHQDDVVVLARGGGARLGALPPDVDGLVAEGEVAGERADRDPPLGEVRLRDDPDARRREPRQRPLRLEQTPGEPLEGQLGGVPAAGRDVGARLVREGVEGEQRSRQLPGVTAPHLGERRVAVAADGAPAAPDEGGRLAPGAARGIPPAAGRLAHPRAPGGFRRPAAARGRGDDEAVALRVVEDEVGEREDVGRPREEVVPLG